jgi:hypothetical protein
MADTYTFPSPDALLEARIVLELLKELTDAFPTSAKAKNQDGMLRTYRMHLAGVSEEAARGGVRSIVRNDERFPSVSRMLTAAHEWTRRNKASVEYQIRHDPNVCQSCRQPFTRPERWRPVVVVTDSVLPPGSIALTPDREAIYLEPYFRDVCACHAPCAYTPDITEEAHARYGGRPTMPIALIPPNTQFRIVEAYARKRSSWRKDPPAPTIADEVKQLAAGGAK